MGADEMKLNQFSVTYSCPRLIATDTCVGHLSFGGQNDAMKKYYLENKMKFKIKGK